MKKANLLCIAFFILAFVFPVNADVKLPGVISSGMVLQRDKEIKIWGWAGKTEKVTIIFNKITKSVKADKNGDWMLVFPPMKAGGPHSMTIKGKNQIELTDILIGDVWICSGQSNMEWPVSRSVDAGNEISGANYPEIRLLTIPHNMQLSPVEDVQAKGWKVCNPENIPAFSAVGYFFGREIHTRTGVPVGLINTSWGGTNVEAWTSKDYLLQIEDFRKVLNKTPEDLRKQELAQKELIQGILASFGLKEGENIAEDWSAENVDMSGFKTVKVPGLWETRGLPGIDGTVWYRKEFDISAEMLNRTYVLCLGKIDDGDVTWINGVKVGNTVNQYDVDREYPIPAGILKPGKNVISVKVEDFGGGGGFWSGNAALSLKSEGFSIPLAGEWNYRLTSENITYSLTPQEFNPNQNHSSLFNGMIHPLLNLNVRGAIWYQGEANAPRAYQYRELFPLMIRCWREKWAFPDLPFFFVQLANFKPANDTPAESDWAELREAQLMALQLPYTGMAVTIDIGETNDIHPRNKQDVGYRLALNALKMVYGEDLVYQGPLYEKVLFSEGKAFISFNHKGEGLVIKDKYGYINGFAIAGKDREFHWAKAILKDDMVIVWSDKVSEPVAVRYGWADNPDDLNLYNSAGLPASPFRTDDWPGITLKMK